jgi:ComF family protein
MESGAGVVKAASPATWPARLGALLLDFLYPPVCLACDRPLAAGDCLCATCFRRLRPITAPHCPVLGLPFEAALGPGALSAEAIADPPPFRRARSAVVYNEVARLLVGRLKYGDRPELARLCARLMAQAGRDLWAERPVLVPVPLHRRRLFARRYNQSAELARALGRLTGLAVDAVLVRRVRPTRQQVGLSADARRRNVSGAFAAHPDLVVRLRGRPVVLVDDVMTTGSTLRAATRTLAAAGAEKIDVISFARVVTGSDAQEMQFG